jgi:transcriptional regulator with XRE-family HTH domain
MSTGSDSSSRSAAEPDLEEPVPRIGEKLREVRKKLGLTQLEVASRVGVSKGFLSQVEHNVSQVSVAKLLRICETLGISIGSLFDSSSSALVRRGKGAAVNLGGHGVQDFLLTPPNNRGFRLVEAFVSPLGTSGEEAYAFRNELEAVHVLTGALEIMVDGERFELGEGDTLTFPGDSLHTWRNPSSELETHVFWVLVQLQSA